MSDDKVTCDVEECIVAYARGRIRVRRGYRFIVAYKDGEDGECEMTATCLDRVCQHGLVDKYNAAHPPESTLLMVTRSRSQSRDRSVDPKAPAATVVDHNLEVSVEVPEMAGLNVGSKADNPSDVKKMGRGSLQKLADDLLVQHGFVEPGKVENQAAVSAKTPEADLRKTKASRDENKDVSIDTSQTLEPLNNEQLARREAKEKRRAEKKKKRQAKKQQKHIDGKAKEMLTAMGYSEEVINDIFSEIKTKEFETAEDKIKTLLDVAQQKTKAALAKFQELSTQETQSSASSSVSTILDTFEMLVGENTDEAIKQALSEQNFVMTEKVTIDGAVYMKMVKMGETTKILVELDTAVEYFHQQFYQFLKPLGLQSP